MLRFTQYLLRSFLPSFYSFFTKLFYSSSNVVIGNNFRCDSIPRILIDKNAKLVIGDNVQFRRNVELRIHGNAEILIGDNCRIDRGVRLLAANNSKIVLNTGVRVGLYSVFNGGDTIEVGKSSLISGFVYLQTSMHNYKGEGNIQNQGYSHAPVHLGEDCWLGTHVVVFPGVKLGDRAIVGSNAVVNKSFEKDSVVGGIPAKILTIRR